MSTNPNADAWIESYNVRFGFGEGTESLRDSLVSTNGAAHRTQGFVAALYPKIDMIYPMIEGVAEAAADAVLHGERWKWQNQPEGGEGTNDLAESMNATNGQVYRTAADVAALQTEVAGLRSDVAALRTAAAQQTLLLKAIAGALKVNVAATLAVAAEGKA